MFSVNPHIADDLKQRLENYKRKKTKFILKFVCIYFLKLEKKGMG